MTFTEDKPAAITAATAPTGWYASGGKRAIDLAIVLPLLVVATPILVAAALALRTRLGPGIVLRQQRIGRNAEPFTMFKLRTMEHSRRTMPQDRWHGPDRRTGHKHARDPRHTTLGRMLRKFSVDELPQLVNVLRGDMSLVGPRPQVAAVASASFRAHSRHLVRPGLTGPFQVSPLRAEGDLDSGLTVDAAYVDALNFRSDLRFLVSTVRALVGGTGS